MTGSASQMDDKALGDGNQPREKPKINLRDLETFNCLTSFGRLLIFYSPRASSFRELSQFVGVRPPHLALPWSCHPTFQFLDARVIPPLPSMPSGLEGARGSHPGEGTKCDSEAILKKLQCFRKISRVPKYFCERPQALNAFTFLRVFYLLMPSHVSWNGF